MSGSNVTSALELFGKGPKILSVNVKIRVKMLLFEISSPNNGNVISMCQIDCVIEEVCLQPNIPLVTSRDVPRPLRLRGCMIESA